MKQSAHLSLHLERMNLRFLIAYWAHLPVIMLVAWVQDSNLTQEAFVACYIARIFRSYVIGVGQTLAELGQAGVQLDATSRELALSSMALADESGTQVSAVAEISTTLQQLSEQSQRSHDQLELAR